MPDKFNYVKRGYDPSEVDNYIDSLENILKSYKDKDTAIKNALVNAQIAADNIVRNAEIEVESSREKAVAQLEAISRSVARQKSMMDYFKSDYRKVADMYLKEIDERDFQPIYDQISALEDFLNSLKSSTEHLNGESSSQKPENSNSSVNKKK
ncbi:MAG: DivIVA domain-containing protein [Clostridiales bacterium]|nr:DivIVA domain-containing protein [Clostridiales bacterium]